MQSFHFLNQSSLYNSISYFTVEDVVLLFQKEIFRLVIRFLLQI